ncbi:MAG: glycosyltransferase family 4 protein [Oscillospiraceae bacterium]|nr:glycosyltransferase family 4 protein [Oscillospiraceae bacterium]
MSTKEVKRKILITTDLYTVTTNGVVTSVQNLFEELTEKGHDVRILTISDTLHSHKDGAVYYIRSVPLKAVYPDLRMPTSYRHKLIQEIIDWKPDVVHSQCEFFSYQFAARISRITGAPLVHTYHTLYEQYLTSYVVPSKRLGDYLARVLSRRRLKRVDSLVAPTQKVETTLQNYGMRAPIRVVPSGISLEQHHQRLEAGERLKRRRELGIGEDDQVMINLGRLGGEKNLDELIRLFAQAREQNNNLKFLIVGDGPARNDLEKLAKELGVGEHVIFTGMVPPAQVQNYYQLGDVFVSASTSETQGLTYIEAAANGLPLLCRQDDCLADVLQEGENGYEYTSAEDFLRAIDAVMDDPQWRAAAARRSEEIAAAFDKKNFGEAIETVYESVL